MNSIKTVGSINEGNEYLFISETFKESDKSVLYIARNDKEIFKIRKKLEWVLPQINIEVFRSWDQIPYDNYIITVLNFLFNFSRIGILHK